MLCWGKGALSLLLFLLICVSNLCLGTENRHRGSEVSFRREEAIKTTKNMNNLARTPTKQTTTVKPSNKLRARRNMDLIAPERAENEVEDPETDRALEEATESLLGDPSYLQELLSDGEPDGPVRETHKSSQSLLGPNYAREPQKTHSLLRPNFGSPNRVTLRPDGPPTTQFHKTSKENPPRLDFDKERDMLGPVEESEKKQLEKFFGEVFMGAMKQAAQRTAMDGARDSQSDFEEKEKGKKGKEKKNPRKLKDGSKDKWVKNDTPLPSIEEGGIKGFIEETYDESIIKEKLPSGLKKFRKEALDMWKHSGPHFLWKKRNMFAKVSLHLSLDVMEVLNWLARNETDVEKRDILLVSRDTLLKSVTYDHVARSEGQKKMLDNYRKCSDEFEYLDAGSIPSLAEATFPQCKPGKLAGAYKVLGQFGKDFSGSHGGQSGQFGGGSGHFQKRWNPNYRYRGNRRGNTNYNRNPNFSGNPNFNGSGGGGQFGGDSFNGGNRFGNGQSGGNMHFDASENRFRDGQRQGFGSFEGPRGHGRTQRSRRGNGRNQNRRPRPQNNRRNR